MRKFDYSFLNNGMLPARLVNLTAGITELKTMAGVRKDEYASDGWDTNENDYFPFIENFLSTLYMCYKELDKRFAIVNGKKITKKSRVEATVLNSLTPISKSEICKLLPDVSPTTVEAVLGQMVNSGSIKKIGDGRNSRYIKNT